jgi:MFS superfamily sulfate permease-like transporter/CRP-like cAMP-binding protein
MSKVPQPQVNPYLQPQALHHGAARLPPWLTGISAALQGLPGAVTPIVLAVSAFGVVAVPWAWWGVLVSTTLGLLVMAWLGGNRMLVAGNRSASTLMFITLVQQTSQYGAQGELQAVVLLGAQMSLVLAGFWLLIAAQLKSGRLLRMIPYPVIAGVSNATAIIVLWLAARTILGDPWSAGVTAVVMGLVAWGWGAGQRAVGWIRPIPAVIPAIGAGLAVLLIVFPSALPHAQSDLVRQVFTHWPGPDGRNFMYTMLRYGSVILPGSLALAILLVLESFVAAVRLEAEYTADVDYDAELKALGAANLFGGLVGGLPVTRSVIRSLAVAPSHNEGWSPHLLCALITVAVLTGLGGVLLELPAGLIAGLLLIEGVMIVDAWTKRLLGDTWRHGLRSRQGTPLSEEPRVQAMVLLGSITLIGVFGSLLWATVAGLALAIMFTLVRLSKSLAAYWEYADTFRSRRMRSITEDVVIRHRTERIAVLMLKGSIFFGNSFRISALADELSRDTQIAVLDFAQVDDVDATGAQALRILTQRLQRGARTVLYSSITADRAEQLRALGLELPARGNVFEDLDHALESAEDRLLLEATMKLPPTTQQALASNLLVRGLEQQQLYDLLSLCTIKQFRPGDWLFHENRKGEGVMMIESGLVTVVAAEEPGSPRVATFAPGQFLGEMSFVEGGSYSRSARADMPTKVAVLSREALAEFAQRHPLAAVAVVNNISRELASRLRATTGVLEALSGRGRQGRWVRTSA